MAEEGTNLSRTRKNNAISRKSFVPGTWEPIGVGSFGEVWKVQLDMRKGPVNPYVAVKILMHELDSMKTKEEKIQERRPSKEREKSNKVFLDELNSMSKIDHPNVIQLIGMAPPEGVEFPWLIMEYACHDDLLSCLKQDKLSVKSLLKISLGVAKGMKYLHNRMNINHKDLAARNCLVGLDLIVKIANFGKNCSVNYKDHYYNYDNENKDIPIRWMSPENNPAGFNERSKAGFSKPGDVWAYGMVLFEIWSGGDLPFGDLEHYEVCSVLYNAERTGRLNYSPIYYHKLNYHPSIIQTIINECWEVNPNKRLSFSDITKYSRSA